MALTLATVEQRDPTTKVPALFGQDGAQVVSHEHILLQDSFSTSPPDITGSGSRWVRTLLTTGGSSVSGAVLTLSTGVGSGGQSQFESRDSYPYVGGQTMILRGLIRFGTDGIAGNTREFGIRQDVSNYVAFVLDGTSLVCRVQSGGSVHAPDVPVTKVNPDDNTFMDLEIRVTKQEARFLVNTAEGPVELAHFSAIGTQTPLQQAVNSKLWMRALNSGSTQDNTMLVDDVIFTRISQDASPAPNRSIRFSTAVVSGNLIFDGIGTLVGVVTDVDNGQTWTVDGNAGTLFRKAGTGYQGLYVPFNVQITNSLTWTLVSGATADHVTILYRT